MVGRIKRNGVLFNGKGNSKIIKVNKRKTIMFIKDKSWGVVEKRGNVSQVIFSYFIGGLSRCHVKLINQTNTLSRICKYPEIQKAVKCDYSRESDCF